MTARVAGVVLGVVLACASGADRVVAAQQLPNNAPGHPTEARVTVINQGPQEAVPVSMMGMPSVLVNQSGPLEVKATRQTWEYRTVTVTTRGAEDLSNAINPLGDIGWEAVGLTTFNGGVAILLKRPQQR